MKLFSARHRPAHLGPYPHEQLRRQTAAPDAAVASAARLPTGATGTLSNSIQPLFDLLADSMAPLAAKRCVSLTESPEGRSQLLKSLAYFFDAAVVGCCRHGDRYAVVLLTESGPVPEPENLAHQWMEGAQNHALALRAGEIAVVLAGYLQLLGYRCELVLQKGDTTLLSGLCLRTGTAMAVDGTLSNPFLDQGFGAAAVLTELELASDQPLVPQRGGALALGGLAWATGYRGTRSALARWWLRRRRSDLSRFPMESLRRTAQPTTRIHQEEIPRVPMRAAFFSRAARGDLGAKAQSQMPNFVDKEPLSKATRPLQAALVPLQEGPVAHHAVTLPDPAANARGLKSLGYHLGVDLIGICEVPHYCWFSHDERGQALEPRHRYGIVLLIDQGYDTMAGASGDDWISGAQSMRAYLRGMEVAILLADHLRRLGYAASAHSNAHGEVLQLPLILQAGLGELSRIGEVVLNPFVGPRFKSAVVTTELPLAIDQPLDFGLQDMCEKCRKCARECPCNAISWGDKVMFNGYEMWKPDVERCTRYRLTNARGAACGRCMKTCPYNLEGTPGEQLALRLAMHVPALRGPLARLDDKLGKGKRNPVKKWWTDLEIVDGQAGPPRAGSNQRDLNLSKTEPNAPVAYYNADQMPSPAVAGAVPVDRATALDAVRLLETPAEADARRARGAPPPKHYQPPSTD